MKDEERATIPFTIHVQIANYLKEEAKKSGKTLSAFLREMHEKAFQERNTRVIIQVSPDIQKRFMELLRFYKAPSISKLIEVALEESVVFMDTPSEKPPAALIPPSYPTKNEIVPESRSENVSTGNSAIIPKEKKDYSRDKTHLNEDKLYDPEHPAYCLECGEDVTWDGEAGYCKHKKGCPLVA